jgi:hypothetical protein
MSDKTSFDLRKANPGDVIEVICHRVLFYVIITYATQPKESDHDWMVGLAVTCSDTQAFSAQFPTCCVPAVLTVDTIFQISKRLSGLVRHEGLITEIRHNGVSIESPEYAGAALR